MSGRERVKAALPEPEIVTKNGKPVSVILPIKQYQEMLGDWRMRKTSPG